MGQRVRDPILNILPAPLPWNTILCVNDRQAFGLMAAAFERGLRAGRGPDATLRVAGHDDHSMARFTAPALTTMAQDYIILAKNSVATLFSMIENGNPPLKGAERLEGWLILRAST